MATEQTYTLDGPTEFFFPFPVRTAGEVVVELLPGGVLPSSEYEVIGASATATGITIRYPNAPRDGNTDLTITRVTNVDRVSTFLDDLSITATALNAEFDNFLAIIQDGIVNEYRGEWATETFYFELDVVLGPDDRVYVATESHTSDVFTDDVNVENYWRLVADFAAGQQNIDAAVDDAETARDKAEEWAENPEDVEVETGQFSAKHHAAKAEDSEIAAGNSEAAAQISEDNAATSEQNALTSEQNAATSEQNASNSASAALTSEQNAATSEQNAADSEIAASNSASAALTSEQNAATSEQNASNSASAALTSEQNAATSEQNAATSEQNAATSAQNAADTLDNFESQYLGVKTQDPVTDNDGNPLQTGALYYNSTQGQLFLYDGTAWVSAAFDAEGFLVAGNNLSDIDSASVGRTNLGLSYQDVRDLFSAAGDLTYDSATGEFTAFSPDLIQQPENISPANNATDTVLTPELEASDYYSLYGVPMASARWQISEVQDFSTTVVDEEVFGTSTTYTPSSNLDTTTNYYWRVQYKDDNGDVSEFSDATEFTTADIFVETPTITSPADNATDIPEQPVIESSAFNVVNGSDTHVASQWLITRVSDSTVVFDSGEDTSNLESIEVPAGVLDEGEENYTVKVRHKGSTYGFSAYSPEITFTTSDAFFDPNIGDPLQGGFFAGYVISDVDSQKYAIIVSDGDGDTDRTGAGSKQWRTSNSGLSQAQTLSDGKSVMDYIVNNETLSDFPAFEWIQTTLNDTNYNGYNDWYLPARDELELVYRHFKPTTQDNNDGTRDSGSEFGADGATYGTNNSSDPNYPGYTTTDPSQTTVTSFQDGGADYLTDFTYWSSTEYDASESWFHFFSNGYQFSSDKDNTARVRAVRRVAV